ncbi:MAG: hypothetical protein R3B47_11975 [Bacteroidia bacterium]
MKAAPQRQSDAGDNLSMSGEEQRPLRELVYIGEIRSEEMHGRRLPTFAMISGSLAPARRRMPISKPSTSARRSLQGHGLLSACCVTGIFRRIHPQLGPADSQVAGLPRGSHCGVIIRAGQG